jgi:hippurate hydrolase
VRSFDQGVRKRVLDAITRIVNAEAEASGAPKPPEFKTLDRYDLVTNDPHATARVGEALRARFGEDRVSAIPPISASEDFGSFGTEWHAPSVFWTVGGTDPDLYAQAEKEGRLTELPTNHNPKFAPVLHPTLETGVQALVTGACAWLSA